MTKALKFLAALLIAFPAFAQDQRTVIHTYSQPELDQMLAPIALYPDALLSQVLMAATYPDEVSQAARWSHANPGLQGDDAVRAAQNEDWDPSVQSLVAFPQVLARMYDNPGWTQSLGDAFLMQEPQLMDTVQQLRRRAQAAGNLQSSEQMHVQQQGQTIMLQPASPQYVYVPYYDPMVVYGPWWWPAYRPVVWAPWRPYGIRVSLGFFFGNFDWHQRHVRVVHPTAYYYRPRVFVNRTVVVTPHRWQHEPQRRATFAGRQAVQARQQVQIQNQVQRQQARTQVNALPSVQVQPAVQARPVVQAQPAVQAQPSVQARPQVQRQERRVEQRAEQRIERREERQAARVQARPQAPVRTQVQAAPAARVQAPAAVQPQVRMPAAVAPPQPRVERQEQRQERREQRQERREERGQKAG